MSDNLAVWQELIDCNIEESRGRWYCNYCSKSAPTKEDIEHELCLVDQAQKAKAAHEAEIAALVAIKDAVLFGDPLEYAIAHGFRASIEMHKIRYTEGIKAALESYQAATE